MFKELNVGDIVYRYRVTEGKLKVDKGKVQELVKHRHDYLYRITFDDGHYDIMPAKGEFGKVHVGVKLWLSERNEKLARNLFIAHEEKRISKLQKDIENINKLIETLWESE